MMASSPQSLTGRPVTYGFGELDGPGPGPIGRDHIHKSQGSNIQPW